jgi:hypothetical protein
MQDLEVGYLGFEASMALKSSRTISNIKMEFVHNILEQSLSPSLGVQMTKLVIVQFSSFSHNSFPLWYDIFFPWPCS